MIVGVAGLAGSGKSTFARILRDRRAFVEVSLAAPLKRFCGEVFGFSREQLYGPSSERNAIDPRYGISPRQALQTLGTEWGRALWPDVWIARALRDARQYPAVVISDCRFRNELAAIREAGGVLVRLTRGSGLVGDAGAHASEAEQASIPDDYFDAVIDNRAMTLEELEAAAVELVDSIVADGFMADNAEIFSDLAK